MYMCMSLYLSQTYLLIYTPTPSTIPILIVCWSVDVFSLRRLLEMTCKNLRTSASTSPPVALAMAFFRVAGWFGPHPIPITLLLMAAQILR